MVGVFSFTLVIFDPRLCELVVVAERFSDNFEFIALPSVFLSDARRFA
jgi:hypothetical protein